jgi:signal transduction histidine kinase/HPt (histidine-containing phosphotransfer) domain-containing protein/ActR/RegA family two-component response regulator
MLKKDRNREREEQALAMQRMESLLALNRMGDQPLDKIIEKVVEDAIRVTRSQIGYLAVLNEDESVLTMQYWSKSAHACCAVVDKPIVYPVEQTGLWGEAVRQRKPIITNDYAAPHPWKRGVPEGHVPIVRHMNIPVLNGTRIVAVAGVGNKATNYDACDLRQLQLLMEGWQHIVARQRAEKELRDYAAALESVNQALAEAKRAAESASQAKSAFLANMSHDIRTPMTSILGYTDLLMDDSLGPAQRKTFLATLRRNGEYLLQLINDILDLSKIEAGKMDVNLGPCHLPSTVAEVASMMRPRAEQRANSLEVCYRGPLPEIIHTDAGKVRQVLVNLVGNAVKFTEQGSIRIAVAFLPQWRPQQPAVSVEVTDTGIGISPEVLPRLFEPFVQADSSPTRKYEGTGLGLAICRRIVAALGGEITVESAPGRGSTFSVMIPAGDVSGVKLLESPGEAVRDTGSGTPSAPSPAAIRGVKILLAEDSVDNQELLCAVLGAAGAEVEVVDNGRQAVTRAEAGRFDLVFMDMNMPEMDGYAATARLRDAGYPGPILALTANAMSGDAERCLAAGCDAHLAKPIDRHQLIETVAHYTMSKTSRAAPPANDGRAAGPWPAACGIASCFAHDPIIANILPDFVGRLSGQVDALHKALADENLEHLERLAHRLKGAGGSYGYPALSETAKSLEAAAKARSPAEAAARLAGVAEVCAAIQTGWADREAEVTRA